MTVVKPSGDLAGYVGGRCTPVHPGNEVYNDDGPARVYRLKEVVEVYRG